ncbi:AP2 domain-containing protein [bacterium]|nr:AP2 domain-containing protein [bacterium]
MRICDVEGCDKKHKGHGYCDQHYQMFKKTGDPLGYETERHGLGTSREYRVWRSMKQRCLSPTAQAYHNYGGRGITVCKSWAESFIAFYKDMGARPSDEYSLDRIDNNGNYEPSNCRWTTIATQQQNRRPNKNSPYKVSGVRKAKSGRWKVSIGANTKVHHLGTYDTFEEAVEVRFNAEEKYWGRRTNYNL